MLKKTGIPLAISVEDEQDTFYDTEIGIKSELSPVKLEVPTLPSMSGPVMPPFRLCTIDLKQGCYGLYFEPLSSFKVKSYFVGTLRVESGHMSKIISGDLYRYLKPVLIDPFKPLPDEIHFRSTRIDIPIFPRRKYYSYLKGISYYRPLTSKTKCTITIEVEEWVYNQPALTSDHNGSFNSTPSRVLKIILEQDSVSGVFTGNVYNGRIRVGTITLKWISEYFRRAVVEIDTLKGAVAPQPVNPGTQDEENFSTVFRTAGWEMTPIYNDTDIASPAGVIATNCWSDADLHALMLTTRNTGADLDKEWRYHMLVVPAKMNCSRGKMYDRIGDHREGVVSYSDDGYPTTDSSYFGAATNKKQRDIPRAFLRSASHELGHCANMQHQELEGGQDNSIMTTTPSVADVLGTATTGDPGVFPDNINLGFNNHCRHHLVHFPDPVVRPGCMNWTAGHPSLSGAFAPSSDDNRVFFSNDSLEFTLLTQNKRIKIGEPLLIAWEVENKGKEDIYLPNDIGVNIDYTVISVTDPDGKITSMNNFILECERSSIKKLEPGKKLAAATNLFWSSNGFAFTKPGKNRIEICIRWTHNNTAYGLHTAKEIWVDYPIGEKDNEIGAAMLNSEVGMFVALGGNAYHLKEAVKRIESVINLDPKHPVSKAFSRFYSLKAANAYVPFKLTRTRKK